MHAWKGAAAVIAVVSRHNLVFMDGTLTTGRPRKNPLDDGSELSLDSRASFLERTRPRNLQMGFLGAAALLSGRSGAALIASG